MGKRKKPVTNPDELFEAPPVVGKSVSASTQKSVHPNTLAATVPYRWKLGQSGNPGGRPKTDHQMKARAANSTELALGVLERHVRLAHAKLEWAIEVLSDPQSSAQEIEAAIAVADSKVGLDAARELLDRGHGRPQQRVEVDHRSALDDIDPDQADEWLLSKSTRVLEHIIQKRKTIDGVFNRTTTTNTKGKT